MKLFAFALLISIFSIAIPAIAQEDGDMPTISPSETNTMPSPPPMNDGSSGDDYDSSGAMDNYGDD